MAPTIEEPSRKVKTGDRFVVDIPEPEPAIPLPQALDLDILYEDSDLLVLNKPAGLVVHPAPGNPDHTLVNALLAHCGDSLSGIGGVRRPGIVHRLDKNTSGVMVVAKNDRAHQALSKLFAAHDLTRIYQALVWGAPKRQVGHHRCRHRPPSGRPQAHDGAQDQRPGRRSPNTGWRSASGRRCKPIASLVGAKLETGRTHQVRVHLAHIGCPVVGDPVYGRKPEQPPRPEALKSFATAGAACRRSGVPPSDVPTRR